MKDRPFLTIGKSNSSRPQHLSDLQSGDDLLQTRMLDPDTFPDGKRILKTNIFFRRRVFFRFQNGFRGQGQFGFHDSIMKKNGKVPSQLTDEQTNGKKAEMKEETFSTVSWTERTFE